MTGHVPQRLALDDTTIPPIASGNFSGLTTATRADAPTDFGSESSIDGVLFPGKCHSTYSLPSTAVHKPPVSRYSRNPQANAKANVEIFHSFFHCSKMA